MRKPRGIPGRTPEWLRLRAEARKAGGAAWDAWLAAHPSGEPNAEELAAAVAAQFARRAAERAEVLAKRAEARAAKRRATAEAKAAKARGKGLRARGEGEGAKAGGGGVPASGSPGLPAAPESHSALSEQSNSALPSALTTVTSSTVYPNGYVAKPQTRRVAVPMSESESAGSVEGGASLEGGWVWGENGSPPTSLESGSLGVGVSDRFGLEGPLYDVCWPTDREDLLALRQMVMEMTRGGDRSDMAALFAEDPAAWLAMTGWTYRVKETGADGRERPAVVRDVPFVPWPVQVGSVRRLAACVKDGRDVVIRKSRDMGASWLVVGLAVWGWLFHGWQVLLVSRVEDGVDRTGDPDSLFWKVDYLVGSQPRWLLPCDVQALKKGGNWRQHMVLRHPVSGATIAGQASSAHIGRGGRRTFVLFDEFAALEDDDAAWRSASDTASCRIALSTPIGYGTRYDKLVNEARGTGNPELVEMLYYHHPEKAKGAEHRVDFDGTITGVVGGTYVWTPWLGDQLRKRDKVDLAQNVFAEAMGAGAAFFPSAAVTAHRREFGREPRRANWVKGRWVDSPTGRWRLWRSEEEVGSYAIGMDPAYGTGNHASAVCVLDAQTKAMVAMMVDASITPADLAAEVADVARGAFKEAVVAWEVNGPGQSLQRDFEAQRFHRVWKPRREGKSTHGIVDRVGWVSSESSKRILLGNLSRAVQQGEVIVPCTGTLDEMLAYVLDGNGRVIPGRLRDESTGARENHGDRVIALALAWMALDDAPVPGQERPDYAPGSAGELLKHWEVFG